MAHFRTVVQGDRGFASRCGNRSSGIQAKVDGWHGGVLVQLYYNNEDGRDYARVVLTTGSGHNGPEVVLYTGPVDTKGREIAELNRARLLQIGRQHLFGEVGGL